MENIGTVELEKGEYFITINEKINTVFVSNKFSNSILVIDGTAKKIVNKIPIKSPQEIILNPNNRILYAISGGAGFWMTDEGAKISIIDTKTNQIIGSIGEKEGFGDIKLNPKTKLLYATQTKSKKIWVIDAIANTVKEKIKVEGKYRSIAIDEINNKIYLAGRKGIWDKSSFAVIDGENNDYQQIKSSILKSGNKIWELYYNQINKKLYAFIEYITSGDGDHYLYIQSLDLDSKSFEKNTESRSTLNGMGFDQSKNRFYFSDVIKGEFSILNDSLEEMGRFKFAESVRGFLANSSSILDNSSKFAINSELKLIYIADSERDLLHIIKE